MAQVPCLAVNKLGIKSTTASQSLARAHDAVSQWPSLYRGASKLTRAWFVHYSSFHGCHTDVVGWQKRSGGQKCFGGNCTCWICPPCANTRGHQLQKHIQMLCTLALSDRHVPGLGKQPCCNWEWPVFWVLHMEPKLCWAKPGDYLNERELCQWLQWIYDFTTTSVTH